MENCNCKGCDKRYVGCHAKCENYIKFRKELTKRKEKERKNRLLWKGLYG